MDNTINENSNQRSAGFLEQCRAEIDQLAAEGASALDDAMVFAEKQLRACTMEWKQANKTVESSSGTQKSLLQIRQTTEQRLALAQSEENDAHLAASTLQRMIEEARGLCDTASEDTSHILFKTSDVLQETFQRAESSYIEKKNIRQEVEGALRRLESTDKAVKYSIAKAERNSGEKMLNKLMAERRCDVYKAEAESLRLGERLQALVQRREEERQGLADVEDLLASAGRSVTERAGLEQLHQETSAAELAACQADIDAAIQAIEINITCMEEEKTAAEAQLEQAQADYERCLADGAAAEEQARQVRENGDRAVDEARADQEQQLAGIEEELRVLRTNLQEYSAAYDNALVEKESAARSLEELNRQMEDCYQQVQTAVAEEKSARDAAGTASRLVDNAAKIRENINSESSDLLRHAQETLMEAAASAQSLMKEKGQARQNAQLAYDQVQERAAAAGNKADEAELNLEIVQLDRDQAQERLAAAEEQAAERRNTLADALAAVISSADEERTAADKAVIAAKEGIISAKTFLENASENLQSIIQGLPELLAGRKQQEESGAARLRDLGASHQAHGVELARMRQEAEAEVERLTGDRNERRIRLQSMDAEVEQVEELCSGAKAKVDEILAAGLRDILSAEEMVADLRYKEDLARSAAGDVVSLLTENEAAPAPEEAAAEEAPAEEAPIEEAPAEEAPAEESPVDEAPVEEAPIEEAPAEEAPVEESPVEEAPVEEAPADEAAIEEEQPLIRDEEEAAAPAEDEADAEYSQRLSAKSEDLLRSMQQAAEAGQTEVSGEDAAWMDNLTRDLGITQPDAAEGRPRGVASADIKLPQMDVAEDGPMIQDAVMEQADQALSDAHAEEDELRQSILTNVDKAPDSKKNRFFNFFRS